MRASVDVCAVCLLCVQGCLAAEDVLGLYLIAPLNYSVPGLPHVTLRIKTGGPCKWSISVVLCIQAGMTKEIGG